MSHGSRPTIPSDEKPCQTQWHLAPFKAGDVQSAFLLYGENVCQQEANWYNVEHFKYRHLLQYFTHIMILMMHWTQVKPLCLDPLPNFHVLPHFLKSF